MKKTFQLMIGVLMMTLCYEQSVAQSESNSTIQEVTQNQPSKVIVKQIDNDTKVYSVTINHHYLRDNGAKERAAEKYASLDWISDSYFDSSTNEVVFVVNNQINNRDMLSILRDFNTDIRSVEQITCQ